MFVSFLPPFSEYPQFQRYPHLNLTLKLYQHNQHHILADLSCAPTLSLLHSQLCLSLLLTHCWSKGKDIAHGARTAQSSSLPNSSCHPPIPVTPYQPLVLGFVLSSTATYKYIRILYKVYMYFPPALIHRHLRTCVHIYICMGEGTT